MASITAEAANDASDSSNAPQASATATERSDVPLAAAEEGAGQPMKQVVAQEQQPTSTGADVLEAERLPSPPQPSQASLSQDHPSSSPSIQPANPPSHPPTSTRKQSEALGPATESTIAAPVSTGPALSITLMLTTGARHPYKIDEKYLSARDTVARAADGTFDPRMISGYKLKELIWTDWRSEWEPRPAAPGSIRLINMGQMVDDKKTLNDYRFTLDAANVIHMTVKPADFGDDEETAGKGGKSASIRQRDSGDGGAGCRCVIL